MKMLRQWNGDSLKPIIEMFEQFGLASTGLRLLKYEGLSPDSFLWVLGTKNGRFCLYAEDFVPSLEHVLKVMGSHGAMSEESAKYELVKVKKPSKWDKSSPVTVSDTYLPPKNPEEFMKFAIPSGYYFIFLGKSVNN